jgi:hypothetical protein
VAEPQGKGSKPCVHGTVAQELLLDSYLGEEFTDDALEQLRLVAWR